MFNPLEQPGCLQQPDRITALSAWTHHLPVAMALVEALEPRVLVELGTHLGDSYCAFCQAVATLELSTRCYAVDTWQGDEHSGKYGDEVYEELSRYHDTRYGHFSQLLRMEFDAARPRFAPGSVDLLHIDGFHSYEAVRHDFETWRETISDRGIVLFHDILVREQGFGVWRLWQEVSAEYEHFEFAHVHGLGVLLVGDQHPAPLKRLAEAVRRHDSVGALFDALGSRASLQQTRLRQDQRLSQLDDELSQLTAHAAAQQAELDRQRTFDHERQQHLDHWVAQARQLASEVERLSAELQHYQQAHYRLLEKFNRLLQKVGPLHRATKAAAEWSVSQAERWRSPPKRLEGIRPPAASADNPRG